MLEKAILPLTLAAALAVTSSVGSRAENLLVNPDFDSGTAPWATFSEAGSFESRWDALDRDDSPSSGSAYVHANAPSTGTLTAIALTQCVPVVAGETYTLAADLFIPSGQTGLGSGDVRVLWRAGASCTQGFLTAWPIELTAEGAWTRMQSELVAPAGMRSVEIRLGVSIGSLGGGSREAYFDNLFFGTTDAAPTRCVASASYACIGDRFGIEVDFETALGGGDSGSGTVVSLGGLGIDRGVLFWFFSPGNPEMLVKVLDGCEINRHFWVFYSAGTNVGFDLRVTDHDTGTLFRSVNPDGTAAPPVQATDAFPCP